MSEPIRNPGSFRLFVPVKFRRMEFLGHGALPRITN
jgi:hypothetical protein